MSNSPRQGKVHFPPAKCYTRSGDGLRGQRVPQHTGMVNIETTKRGTPTMHTHGHPDPGIHSGGGSAVGEISATITFGP